MAVMGSLGTERARSLLNDVPDRFNDFCHMDQITFIQLADWIVEHAESNEAPGISVEESLFVFLDIVAQGNSFRSAAYSWDHDIQITQTIFLSVMNALQILREKEDLSPSCPAFNAQKSRWRIIRSWRGGKTRMDGMVKVGDEGGGGLDISKESLTQALTALNNFIHEHREF